MTFAELTPSRCMAFFTRGPWWEPVTLGIRWLSRPSWCGLAEVSHMGLEWLCRDGASPALYYKVVAEAHSPDGFRVKPSKLQSWRERGNRVWAFPLADLTLDELAKGYAECLRWDGAKEYDHPLIAKLAMRGSLTGRFLNARVRGNGLERVDCSEAACAILARMADRWDLRKRNEPFGAITPQDALTRLRERGVNETGG